MPLDQLTFKLEQFTGQLEIFMHKNFNVTSQPEDVYGDETSSQAIAEMKKRIIEIECNKFDNDLTLAGFNSIIQNIDELKHRFGSELHDVRSIIDAVEEENEALEFQLEVIRKEALMLVEQLAERKMEKILIEHFQALNKHKL